MARGFAPTQNIGGQTPVQMYGVGTPIPSITRAVEQARADLATAETELSTAEAELQEHRSGHGMFFGTRPTDRTSELLVLDDTRLALDLTVANAETLAAEGPFACALPCTLRYLFEDKKGW